MAYHSDVQFLEDCNPALIERNAAEFERIGKLLDSVVDSVNRAKDGTVWESASRENYDARLADVRELIDGLFTGFTEARTALLAYADGVEEAKQWLDIGMVAERRLDALVSSVATAVTRTAQTAEPMRRWEDISSTTSFLDWVAELGMDVDEILGDATRAYNQAGDAFGRAQAIEGAARQDCISKVLTARALVPDFRGDFKGAAGMIDDIASLRAEMTQASGDPNVALPGTGVKADFPGTWTDAVSPELRRIRELLQALPPGANKRDPAEFIKNNKALIYAAAQETGLPPDMIAGIAWKEVGGKPYEIDDVTEKARRAAENGGPIDPTNLPGRLAGDPDNTSYGPMAVQIRRAAEVLGYDPATLTDAQRDEIRSALKDPAQNLFISAKYVENLKAETSFANVPYGQMSPGQYQELAARYNGGPNWQSGQAQDYGRDFEAHRQEAAGALR